MTKSLISFIFPKFILVISLFSNLVQANTLYKDIQDKDIEYCREDLERGIKRSNVNVVNKALKYLENNNGFTIKDKIILLTLANETVEFRRNNVALSKAGRLTGERQDRSTMHEYIPEFTALGVLGLGIYYGKTCDYCQSDKNFVYAVSGIVAFITYVFKIIARDSKDNHILYHNSVEIRKLIQQL